MGLEIVGLTWQQLNDDVLMLGKSIAESGFKPDLLVAVARGGWVIGRMLSDILGVKRAVGITISSYEDVGKRKGEPVILQPLNIDIRGLRVLVVDDIVDTGATLKVAVDHVRGKGALEVKSAAPYVKPWSTFRPDYYVRIVDKWVVFPYEYFETLESLRKLSGVNAEEVMKSLFRGKSVRVESPPE